MIGALAGGSVPKPDASWIPRKFGAPPRAVLHEPWVRPPVPATPAADQPLTVLNKSTGSLDLNLNLNRAACLSRVRGGDLH